ncbi:MAG: hypothetical protein V4560_12265 [Bacteroidota bacterium]|jgi:hypothetical protein
MKFYKLLSSAFLLLLACNNTQQQPVAPVIHINAVVNRLSLLSDTSLSVKLLTAPPKGLSRILLVSGNMVLKVANIDSTFKKGDTISLNYPFKNHQHYALYAVGQDLGREYYDMSAYDFTLDIKTRSVLNLRKRRP